MTDVDGLTPAQQRILDQVQARPRSYNGRAQKPIRRLEELGLVTVDWDMRPQAKGSGIELVWHITVTAKGGS